MILIGVTMGIILLGDGILVTFIGITGILCIHLMFITIIGIMEIYTIRGILNTEIHIQVQETPVVEAVQDIEAV